MKQIGCLVYFVFSFLNDVFSNNYEKTTLFSLFLFVRICKGNSENVVYFIFSFLNDMLSIIIMISLFQILIICKGNNPNKQNT
jgi:hypothetical protein